MTIPASSTARVTILARLHDTATLLADGIERGALNGFAVSNQAVVTVAGERRVSDDPDTGAANDPTVFRLTARRGHHRLRHPQGGVDVNGGFLEPGDRIRYTLAVENTGASATDVFVNDPWPAGTGDCALEAGGAELVCAGGRLQGLVRVGAGATVRVTYTLAVAADAANGLRITNVATVRAADDPAQQVEVRSETLRVTAAPILGTTTKDVPALPGRVVLPGERVRYVITVPNTGNRPATNVVVTDRLGFAFAEVTPQDGGVLANGAISWRIPRIEPGARAAVAFEALLPAVLDDGVLIANQASLASAEIAGPILTDDPTTDAPDDPTVLRVRSQARIEVAKTVAPRTARPGDAVTYTLRVRNTGTGQAGATSASTTARRLASSRAWWPRAWRVAAVAFDAASRPELAPLEVGDEVELILRGTSLPVLFQRAAGREPGDVRTQAPRRGASTIRPPPSWAIQRLRRRVHPALAVDKRVTRPERRRCAGGDRPRYPHGPQPGRRAGRGRRDRRRRMAGLVDVVPAGGWPAQGRGGGTVLRPGRFPARRSRWRLQRRRGPRRPPGRESPTRPGLAQQVPVVPSDDPRPCRGPLIRRWCGGGGAGRPVHVDCDAAPGGGARPGGDVASR
ncbi:MAG: hypothetical protein R3F43_24320 [bacterium]